MLASDRVTKPARRPWTSARVAVPAVPVGTAVRHGYSLPGGVAPDRSSIGRPSAQGGAASVAAQQEPIDDALYGSIGVDALPANAAHHLRRDRAGGGPDEGREVDLLDDVADQAHDVRAVQDAIEVHAVHRAVEV